MRTQPVLSAVRLIFLLSFVIGVSTLPPPINAQDTLTGAFSGSVRDRQSDRPIPDATVRFINQASQVPTARKTDSEGAFFTGPLPPSMYKIQVIANGFRTIELVQRLIATKQNTVQPLPIVMEPMVQPNPAEKTPPEKISTVMSFPVVEFAPIAQEINDSNGRRGGVFTEVEVRTLPLGSSTLTRTFDELALLLPGVALPPLTQGSVAGPGVGPGVGSAGQFSVNGLRSRANNFTVDGSDNNDEDIGVRRQGFISLIPQSIESVEEFSITTILAAPQFGRNLAAQVNVISKSGSDKYHGQLYGLLNTSHLNARDYFDTPSRDRTTELTVGDKPVLIGTDNRLVPVMSRLNTGGKDSLTLGQAGLTLGGPIPRFGEGPPNALKNAFFFLSAEGQILNANREANFSVPTIEQRGAFNSGATGIFRNPIPLPGQAENVYAFPTSIEGDAIFSLFPFPNNPLGVYGKNTFTHVLPVSAQGKIVSGKIDTNFDIWNRKQRFAARYNLTADARNIPVTGEALFSGIRSNVQTQNISTYLNSDLSAPDSIRPFFNQLRFSYGRTRLGFDEGRDVRCRNSSFEPGTEPGCLLVGSDIGENLSAVRNEPFFINRPLLINSTLPDNFGSPNTGPVIYGYDPASTTDQYIGPIGQMVMAGFSPVGVDVFNFPQRRVNNTYQLADNVSGKIDTHSITFGIDIRRSELNSDLPRNSRPLITFYGAPRLIGTSFDSNNFPTAFRVARAGVDNLPFLRPEYFAAASAPSGTFMSLSNQAETNINLRYYQFNFFGQDEWKVRPNFSLSYGVRYEFNSVPEESNRKIERTFNAPLIAQTLPGLDTFLAGRTRIFDSDRNNLAPRVSFAYSPVIFGPRHPTVIRGGYGLYYDQILGAVVSQSRNVFPSFFTVNFGGGPLPYTAFGYQFFNPLFTNIDNTPIVSPVPGRPNNLNPEIDPATLIDIVNEYFPNAFGATLPARNLHTPMSHQYQFGFEQQIGLNLLLSAAYVGTQGRNLLRFTTPNLGPNYVLGPFLFVAPTGVEDIENSPLPIPRFYGVTLPPGATTGSDGSLQNNGRPVKNVGAISQFETTAESRYDSLQVQLQGRWLRDIQFQISYTFSRAIDDVSDVFDLAGAYALPQNSLRIDERGYANFDTRHRVAYSFNYRLPQMAASPGILRHTLGGLGIAGTGQFQTGQPFTVNSLFDVNLDGNLTDRPNTSAGIITTIDNRKRLSLTVDPLTLLAAPGRDGAVGRNTFRAGGFVIVNLALIKEFNIPIGRDAEPHKITFRAEAFNLTNRANFGIPVRFLEAPGFGDATSTLTPGRRIQFGLRYSF